MRIVDLIAFEKHIADAYRREATNRRKKSPQMAAQLEMWAAASERRIAALRAGPLFAEDA